MQLKDLIEKNINDLTAEELEFKINSLKKLRTFAPKVSASSKGYKTNEEKQLEDLISSLNPEQMLKLMANLKEN